MTGPGRPTRWTDEMDAALKREWLAGSSIKAIANHLGVGQRAVKRRRAALDLPRRRPAPGSEPTKRHEVRVYLGDDLYRAMVRRCAQRGATHSQYLRSLVMRDVGQ